MADELDFKEIVKDVHMHLIANVMDRILLFEVDSILDHFVDLFLDKPENASKVLIVTDKFWIYKNLWKAIMELLYERYFPDKNYEFNWSIEVTPYTLLICDYMDGEESTEFSRFTSQAGFTEEKIEENFKEVVDEVRLNDYIDRIPENLRPNTRKEQLILIFRLMNFPPLEELAFFFGAFNSRIQQQLSDLKIGFKSLEKTEFPNLNMSEPLHYSFFHFSHEVISENGILELEQNASLNHLANEFKVIKETVDKIDPPTKEVICPCCGEEQAVEIPKYLLQYKALLARKELSREIGLVFFQNFKENFKAKLSEKFYQFIPNINKVDNPKCLILVEGESEEYSIPLLAFRKRFILAQEGIQVYNSKSKQKLKEDFFNYKIKYPNRKMICLLDSDAIKEKDDLERVILDNKDKYRLFYLDNGTFEDLFDLEFSVQILNEIYPNGDEIFVSDFDSSKDFLQNAKRLLFEKKKAQFDKVLFSKSISSKIDVDLIPNVINEIFEVAHGFTR
ncbi:MAG: hypothetical protein R8G66_24105 [Cytophagales bacterium]|nr:hypothetical protein [Cytophagales bacterium]